MIMQENFYDRNIEALQKFYPQVVNMLNVKDTENLTIDITDAKDGNKSMVIARDNLKLTIHGKYRPLVEAENWYGNLNLNRNSIVMVFGFGLGYHIKELVKNAADTNSIIIIEPSRAVFKSAVVNEDLSTIVENPNVKLFIGVGKNEIKRILFEHIQWEILNNIGFCCIPNYDKLFFEEYSFFIKNIKSFVDTSVIAKNTVFSFAMKWTKNFYENFPVVSQGYNVKQLEGKFEGKPAIIVSAGPSLNKNVNCLKDAKGKAVIICVDTALRILLRHGIKPDFVVTADGDVNNFRHFENIEYNDLNLMAWSTSYYEILKNHPEKNFLVTLRDDYIKKILQKYNKESTDFGSGGSVSHIAFQAAVLLGASPVIFVGQDLAYTGNISHAEGTALKQDFDALKNREDLEIVKDADGNDIYTSRTLKAFLMWFEDAIEQDSTGRLYINATEGGAKIHGAVNLTLKEAIGKYCSSDININGIIEEATGNTKLFDSNQLTGIVQDFKDNLNELARIRKKASEAEKLSEELHDIFKSGRYKYTKYSDILKKLDKIDKILAENTERYDAMRWILKPVIYNIVTACQIDPPDNEVDRGMHAATKSKLLYNGIRSVIDTVVPLMEKCAAELEMASQNRISLHE